MGETLRDTSVPKPYRPTTAEVEDLLRRAAKHPLGTEFLVDGSLDAVAATFRVHAFAVDAARTTLGDRQAEGATMTFPPGRP